jgi:hypothetical protein
VNRKVKIKNKIKAKNKKNRQTLKHTQPARTFTYKLLENNKWGGGR